MFLEIFCILLLILPTVWELINDRKGDAHPNNDWMYRGLLMLLASGAVAIIHPEKNFIQCFLLSFGVFAFFFTYLVNIVHLCYGVTEDRKWWNHLSKNAFPDNIQMWADTPWYGRMFILAVILLVGIKLYVCWEGLFAWDACM